MVTVSQKVIAERLGLNEATISLALSNHPRVSVRTRQAVQAVAREIGYNEWTNRDGRSMVAKRWNKPVRTGIIAVVTPHNSDDPSILHTPYFEAFMRGIDSEAAKRDLSILTCPSNPGALPGIVSAGGIDGVITFVIASDSMALFHKVERPVVWLGALTDCFADATLIPDQSVGMGLVTRHLLELGHRRIAYLGYSEISMNCGDRYDGYRSAMVDAGLFDERLVNTGLESRLRKRVDPEICNLWEKSGGFTALVCYHDIIAMSAIRGLESMGLRVPDDVSVTGFDDISSSFHFEPAISSVRFDRVEMGRRAVQMIQGDCERRSEVFPVVFEARDSTRRLTPAVVSSPCNDTSVAT